MSYKVYIMHAGPYCKIGYALNVEERLHTIQTGCPILISEYWRSNEFDKETVTTKESNIQLKFDDYIEHGEWYKCSFKQAVEEARKICECNGQTIKIKEKVMKKYRTVYRFIDASFPKTIYVSIKKAVEYSGLSEQTIIRILDEQNERGYDLYIQDGEEIKVHRDVLSSVFWGTVYQSRMVIQ